ncbi:DNA-3-methyladenine glycosylase [Mucilaginibacter koreensis]
MLSHFDSSNIYTICNQLAQQHPVFYTIVERYGYPPIWSRPNTFETLVHVILEQQVSLASALSALLKLKERIEEITPARVLLLTDEELKACYFSRQKIVYVKHLAGAIISGQLNLEALPELPDKEIRKQLMQLKGIGNWTVDIYLMMVLHRPDIFPAGDLAIIRTMKMLMPLPPDVTRLQLTIIAESWRPYRTVATYLLWHYYLSRKKPVVKA